LETILVVDDEASVLAVVEEMLKGYRILTAPNAEEAMRVSTSYVGRQLRLQRPR
jgi:CheY-like chemotaxis protein